METTVRLPAGRREASVRAESFNADDNTIEVIWTTGAAVRRVSWYDGEEYEEVLSLAPGAVRLDRLNKGAPFVDTHSTSCLDDVIGRVVPGSAKIEDGKGICRVQLSKAPGVADTVIKIREGVICNVSVGYWQHRIEKTEADDGTLARWDVVDWEPLEISAVPVPADAGAQVRSEDGEAAKTRACVVVTRKPAIAPPPKATASKEPTMAERTAKKTADEELKRLAALRAAKRDEDESETAEDKKADEESDADEGDEDEDKKSDGESDADDADAESDAEDADEENDEDDKDEERKLPASARKAAEAAIKAERARCAKINALAGEFGFRKFGEKHVSAGTSARKFGDLILDKLIAKQRAAGSVVAVAAEEPKAGKRAAAPSAFAREVEEGAAHWARVAGKPAN